MKRIKIDWFSSFEAALERILATRTVADGMLSAISHWRLANSDWLLATHSLLVPLQPSCSTRIHRTGPKVS